MFRFSYLFIIGIFIQTMSAQEPHDIPQRCRGPPPRVQKPHECCKFPPFFSEDDLKECGFVKFDESGPPPKRGPPDCKKQLCMMKKYKLLNDDESVNKEAIGTFLETWSSENKEFDPAVALAKERCLGDEIHGPPGVCEANKIVFCITGTLFMECPTWIENDNCNNLKEHFDECKPFLPH